MDWDATTRIPVVIVESHQHVLEHVHDVLRKKKLFHQSWSMVHFDAHPDLACPKTAPATACFTPRQFFPEDNNHTDDTDAGKNLYELLDLTPSGIAEWILPLALGANLNTIEWVKPKFSTQISEGTYRFAVGVDCGFSGDPGKNKYEDGDNSFSSNGEEEDEITSFLDLSETARVKVDFHHPYYLDDQSVVSSDKLVLKKKIRLQVSELEETDPPKHASIAIDTTKPWILDICLDYFACHNPYLVDLEAKSPSATLAFLHVMEASKFNSQSSSTEVDSHQPMSSFDYQIEIVRFYKLLRELLLDFCHPTNPEHTNTNASNTVSIEDHDGFQSISQYIEKSDDACRLIRRLVQEICNYRDEDNVDDRRMLLSMIVEAIPNWSMPHDRTSVSTTAIQESLLRVEEYVQKHTESDRPPFLITIARSTLDGFCPPCVVEDLQDSVLDLLHRQLCGRNCRLDRSSCCRLRLVRDYGEWEGSTI